MAHYSEQASEQEQQDMTEALKNMELGSDSTLEQEQRPTAPPTQYTPVAHHVAQETTDTNDTNNNKTLSNNSQSSSLKQLPSK